MPASHQKQTLSPSPQVLSTAPLTSVPHFIVGVGGGEGGGGKQGVRPACQCPGGFPCLVFTLKRTQPFNLWYLFLRHNRKMSSPQSFHVAKLHQLPPGPLKPGPSAPMKGAHALQNLHSRQPRWPKDIETLTPNFKMTSHNSSHFYRK